MSGPFFRAGGATLTFAPRPAAIGRKCRKSDHGPAPTRIIPGTPQGIIGDSFQALVSFTIPDCISGIADLSTANESERISP